MTKDSLGRDHESLPLWCTAGTLYQVLMDEKRTTKFKLAIEHTVREGDTVVDIGTGSGILALFAVMAGASNVYAIESDPSNYKAASTVVSDNVMSNVIRVVRGDALQIELPEKADVVICELMSTALLDEPQIRLMNHAIGKFTKRGARIIPKRAITYCEFVTTDYEVYGLKLRVPQYEWSWIPSRARKISKSASLVDLDFTITNEEWVRCSGSVEIVQDGYLNGLRLFTRTYLTDSITHHSSMGFCPGVIIPTEKEFPVKMGDTVSYKLSYMAGYGYSSMEFHVSKVKL